MSKKKTRPIKAYSFIDKDTKQLVGWAMHTKNTERFLNEAIATLKNIKDRGHYYKWLKKVPVIISPLKK